MKRGASHLQFNLYLNNTFEPDCLQNLDLIIYLDLGKICVTPYVIH